jgi:predicted GNAT family acetyltransferase
MQTIKSTPNSFYIGESPEKASAILTFVSGGDSVITIDRTFVCESLRGRGIALKLVNKAVEYARAEHKKIIPACSYAKNVLTGREEYSDVLYDPRSE